VEQQLGSLPAKPAAHEKSGVLAYQVSLRYGSGPTALHCSPLLVPYRHPLPGRSQISANFWLPPEVSHVYPPTAKIQNRSYFTEK
jgi:hypothetical protein